VQRRHFGNNSSVVISASGGSGSFTFSWSPTGGSSASANGLSAGNYTCFVSDINNCAKQQTVTITQPNSIVISVSSQTNILCFGNTNGSVSLSVSGGTGAYSYTWSPIGGNSSIANNLSSGSFTCIVSDANNCSSSKSVTITEPAIISATTILTSPSCINNSDGIAELNISGGTAPYNVNWSNGSSSPLNNNLSAGAYSVSINDANSCNYTLNILVSEASTSCFLVPNGFSPNGDGINDTWEIVGINNYPGAQVSVLNRWGQEVFKSSDYSTPWNGNYNGNSLPTSDYYFIINLNDGSKPLTGTLTIKQ
jgi:gliding motility-associated-like protein